MSLCKYINFNFCATFKKDVIKSIEQEEGFVFLNTNEGTVLVPTLIFTPTNKALPHFDSIDLVEGFFADILEQRACNLHYKGENVILNVPFALRFSESTEVALEGLALRYIQDDGVYTYNVKGAFCDEMKTSLVEGVFIEGCEVCLDGGESLE